MAQLLLVVLLQALLLPFTQAAPFSSFPLNAQVPPVGRVGKPFNFTFSAITFTANVGDISYAIADGPAWLSLDSNSRTFSGTPSSNDVGNVQFNLLGTDTTGPTSMPVKFVVSANAGPQIASKIDDANIFTASVLSGPDSLELYPGSALNVKLKDTTFSNTDATTQYYATLSDNSPLPSWLIFNPSDLSFSGNAPGSTSPQELPAIFDLNVIATDTPGFSSAVFNFRISVDLHQLAFTSQNFNINITGGQAMTYKNLQNDLHLDGNPIDTLSLADVQTNAPGWLSIDHHTLVLSGMPPIDANSSSFWVWAKDVYSNEANTTITLAATKPEQLLSTVIPEIDAEAGSKLSYAIPPGVFLSENLNITLDLGNTSSWLSYNTDQHVLSGTVPKDWPSSITNLNLTVSKNGLTQWESIPLNITQPQSSDTTTPGPNSPVSTTSTSTTSPSVAPNPADSSHRNIAIALSCSFAGALLLGISILLIWCCRTKRLRKRPRNLSTLPASERWAQVNEDLYYANREKQRQKELQEQQQRRRELERLRLSALEKDPFDLQPNWNIEGFAESSRSGTPPTPVIPPKAAARQASIPPPPETRVRRGARLASTQSIGLGHGFSFPSPPIPAAISRFSIRSPPALRSSRRQPNPSWESLSDDDDHFMPTFINTVQANKPRTTIRPVPQSPSPSEIPSPDLNSSPRKRLASFIHTRAAARKASGLFAGSAAVLGAERELIDSPLLREVLSMGSSSQGYHGVPRGFVAERLGSGSSSSGSGAVASRSSSVIRKNAGDSAGEEVSEDWEDDIPDSDPVRPGNLIWSKKVRGDSAFM